MQAKRGWIISLSVGLLALAARPAVAQLDHLLCYKVVDKTAVAAAFDLFAELQPEFTAKGCRVLKVKEFCVPATKLNVTPGEADTRPDVVGPPLYADYIGYRIRCDKQVPPGNKIALDQFGLHRHRKYKVQTVLLPARKGPPPCGTVDGAMCGGVCPSADEQCRIDSTDKQCKCLPPDDGICGGKPDKQGHCGGPCPDPAKPLCQLTLTASGAKVCECGPPPPPLCGINAETGTCGGECPNRADKCVLKSPNECTCEPSTTPCALVPGSAPTCSGDCPIAGDVCALDAQFECRCGPPPPTPCQQNPLTGTCGGECPSGETCRLDAANNCSCGPLPCGSDANGQCDGACPDPDTQVCKVDASGACNCDPPSCSLTGVDICGGVCPPGRDCALITIIGGGLACRCQ